MKSFWWKVLEEMPYLFSLKKILILDWIFRYCAFFVFFLILCWISRRHPWVGSCATTKQSAVFLYNGIASDSTRWGSWIQMMLTIIIIIITIIIIIKRKSSNFHRSHFLFTMELHRLRPGENDIDCDQEDCDGKYWICTFCEFLAYLQMKWTEIKRILKEILNWSLAATYCDFYPVQYKVYLSQRTLINEWQYTSWTLCVSCTAQHTR